MLSRGCLGPCDEWGRQGKETARTVRIWIDATSPHSALRVFGMSLLERHLRAVMQLALQPTEICVALPPDSSAIPSLPHELVERLPLRWTRTSDRDGPPRGVANGEAVVALEADTVVDARLLQYMASQEMPAAARGGDGAERTAILRLDGAALAGAAAQGPLPELADREIERGAVVEVETDAVPGYISNLRRTLPSYLFRVTGPASRDRAEHFLFWSNYKGSTDFFTKYVYPPLVWRATKWLARWRVHPNVLTVFNVLITLGAIPLFAQGEWLLGLLCAYTMSVLDSVDGKLARLTFRTSRLGNILDHGTDLIHPPLWYFAWAWALGGGRADSPIFAAAIWMCIFYIVDRIVVRRFKRRVGQTLYAQSLLDSQLRTFISRRNINVPVFTLGLIVGQPAIAFQLILFWQVASLAYHSVRLLQCWEQKPATPAT
jgi:phosphatidylglycerophosphate synthase